MDFIDKYELHLHLGGSYPMSFLESISSPHEIAELKSKLHKFKFGVAYNDCFPVFESVSKLVNTDLKVENGVYAMCKELKNDGIVYVEIRSGLKDLGSGHEGYLNAILKGISHFESDHKNDILPFKFQAKVLLSLRRNTNKAVVDITLNLLLKYRAMGVIGLDVSGDSTNGDGESIFAIANELRKHNIPITLHICETSNESEEQQMAELTCIQPSRIGHAVHLHPQAKQYIFKHKIPIEMCLSSALQVQMVHSMKDHPALALIHSFISYYDVDSTSSFSPLSSANDKHSKSHSPHPILICTDDPLIFGTTLTQECQYTADLLGLSVAQIDVMQKLARNYTFSHYTGT